MPLLFSADITLLRALLLLTLLILARAATRDYAHMLSCLSQRFTPMPPRCCHATCRYDVIFALMPLRQLACCCR